MKILYVTHRLPYPPDRGGKIRPFHTIEHLARSHEVTVASLVRSRREAADGRDLENHCAALIVESAGAPMSCIRMVARLPTPSPSSMGYFYSPRLARRIRAELKSAAYDLLMVQCSSMAQYVGRSPSIPKLLDFADMDSEKWLAYARQKPFPQSLGYYQEGIKLRRAEREMAGRFDACTCSTPAELSVLNGLRTAKRAGWFRNGVDTEVFKPEPAPYDPDTICFVGQMDYYPNAQAIREFCATVLPLLRAKRPAIRLLIVGADPSSGVRKLGSIPGVAVTGRVLDVRPYLRSAAVSVAPLKIARGTQNKILESMASGVPVVCSPAVQGGVDALAGEHFLTASEPPEYVEAILSILDNPAERARLAVAGRSRMLSHHSWAASMKKLDRIIDECLASKRGRSRNDVTRSMSHIG